MFDSLSLYGCPYKLGVLLQKLPTHHADGLWTQVLCWSPLQAVYDREDEQEDELDRLAVPVSSDGSRAGGARNITLQGLLSQASAAGRKVWGRWQRPPAREQEQSSPVKPPRAST
eukprot:359985-Chlamydomonas_euryale.AAC.10